MIPPAIETLIEIFRSDLKDIRFADMDANGLARLAGDVAAAGASVNEAQAALDAARAKLYEQQETMIQHAHRALAYARIYAETNEPLRAQLEGIVLPKPAKRAKVEEAAAPASEAAPAARRGRKRKVEEETSELLIGAAE